MNDIKLKPCPFCGGKAYIGQLKQIAAVRYIVACNNRSCIAYRLNSAFVPHYYTEHEAIEAWNRRANGVKRGF